MKNKLIIPETLKVGFQNRRGTYTGKLAFVVYKDAKGVLKKEKSWNGWRDQSLGDKTLENEPTSGFVLNKKVGGYGGWNRRQTWVRIYDPRDFEFEISVANLLFILEECSAIKGKGLEGEFVYSWDRQQLLLLPVTAQEYSASLAHTKLQAKKVTKADMVEGCLYKTKEGHEVLYLGHHPWYYTSTKYIYNTDRYGRRQYYGNNCTTKTVQHHAKRHIFVSLDKKLASRPPGGTYRDSMYYWLQAGYTKLAERLSEEPSSAYAGEYEKYKASKYGTKPEKVAKTKKAKA